ncbi:MAG: hydroxyacid dehydrogenase [Ferruginibacter sp.]|nr:hydroxyacid dehydrogenase [Ferruginibacter sp.]
MILITAPAHPYLIKILLAKGYEVEYRPDIGYDELFSLAPSVEGLIVTTRLRVDKSLIDKAPKLKWIGRLGSGMELIDVDYARAKNIICQSSPEGNRVAVAEHALGMLIALQKNIVKSNEEVKHNRWLRVENRGVEISGKTIGIIGYGNTGSSFAKLLSGFDVTLLVFDKYKFNFGTGNIKEANLEQICRYADVISFHIPLTNETYRMAENDFFNALINRPVILNTSRGGVINTSSLLMALENEKISGAGLDVLENEVLSSYTPEENKILENLNAHPRVIITPHIAGYSHEAYLKMSTVLIEKLNL